MPTVSHPTLRALRCLLGLIFMALCPTSARGIEIPAPAAPLTADDAVAAYYRGDVETCLRAYREVLQREPGDVSARRNLVRVLRESGQMQEALEQLDLLLSLRPEVSDLRPEVSDLRLAAAETALLAGEPERSLSYLQSLEPSADSLYTAALALIDLGRREKAGAALEDALERESFRPLGWYRLGLLRYEQGELGRAEEALHRALAQEPNLTASFYPLARIYLAQGQVPRAYSLLRRAEASLPGSRPIRELLQQLVEEHPELVEGASKEQQARREAAAPRKAEALPAGAASLPAIRVGLSEKVRELHLKTGGVFSLDGSPGAAGGPAIEELRGAAGTVLIARQEEGRVEVSDSQGAVLLRSASPVRLAYDDPADTSILFDVQFGQGSYWAGSEDRMYRGAIELIPQPEGPPESPPEGLTVVNILSIEEYLYSVLPSEMPSHWPQAALQAQAVAARSYTMANLGRYVARGFDLVGSVSSAAYRGMGAETASVRGAVDATRGLVLLDAGKPLAAFYSANCGGYTDTTDTAWGFASSLPAVADPLLSGHAAPLPPDDLAFWLADRPVTYSSNPDYCSRSAYRWQLWVPREEIEYRLDLEASLGSIVALVPGARGVSGRVREVRIRGTAGEHTIRGDAIRWRLGGLRSNLFTVEPKLGREGLPEYFVFTGGGWGHGVGLCQSGAAGMAAAGFTAEQILRHYYGGAPLQKLY
jgi:stage II sporulation protein D